MKKTKKKYKIIPDKNKRLALILRLVKKLATRMFHTLVDRSVLDSWTIQNVIRKQTHCWINASETMQRFLDISNIEARSFLMRLLFSFAARSVQNFVSRTVCVWGVKRRAQTIGQKKNTALSTKTAMNINVCKSRPNSSRAQS